MLFSRSCYVIGYFKQGVTGMQDTDIIGILLCLILCKIAHVWTLEELTLANLLERI